jgi:cytochrome P450
MSSVATVGDPADLEIAVSLRAPAAALPLRGLRAFPWFAKFFFDPIGCMTDAHARYGDVAIAGRVSRIQGAERQHVFAFGPQCNRLVLGNTDVFHTTAQAWAGSRGSALRRIRNGLTRMNGVKYQEQRQLLLPTFSKKAVEGYVGDMAAIMGQVLDEEWRAGETVDMYRQMRSTALRVSTQILFGRPEPEEAIALAQLGQAFIPRTFSAGVWFFPFNLPLTPFRRMLRNAEMIEGALRAMIERRRAVSGPLPDLLQILVAAFDEQAVPMDMGDLIGQAAILFVASYENVATVLTWTTFLLAQHPEIMDDVQAELRDVLDGRLPTADDLEKLPLLDAVVKESMRVLPPVPFLVRKVVRPTQIGGFPLKPRDRVVCSAYVTHHSPELYPQPRRFFPDRWIGVRPDPFEYLPFGAGSRACIGKMFAMREIKVALAMILSRHRLTVVPNVRINRRVQVMLSPRHGLPMTIHPADGPLAAVRVKGNIHEMVELPAK